MAYPKIPDADTIEVIIAKRKYVMQELPWHAVVEVTGEFGDVLRAMISAAMKRAGGKKLRDLEWSTKTPALDENGHQIVNEQGEQAFHVEYNVELIADVAISGLKELKEKTDFLPRLIDAAIVDENSEDLSPQFMHIRISDMMTAIKGVITVNLQNSEMGKTLGDLVKTQEAESSEPEADGSTGSSTSTKEPSTKSPEQPVSASAEETAPPQQPASAQSPPL